MTHDTRHTTHLNNAFALFMLLLIACLIFTSCKKDELPTNVSDQQPNTKSFLFAGADNEIPDSLPYHYPTIPADNQPDAAYLQNAGEHFASELASIDRTTCLVYFSQIQSVNGMLSFTDIQHFETVVLCLEIFVEAHNDAFEAIYGHYTDQQIEELLEYLDFNEDQPLIDFEDSFGFQSLRKAIEKTMSVWMNNPVLNMATNPDNHIILDEETRTLLTPDCKAIIAGQVVDFCDPGSADNTMTADPNDKALLFPCSLSNGDCCWWGGDDGELPYDSDKRIIVYVSLKSKLGLGLPSKMKGKVISYKRKNANSWKRFRTPLRISVGGQVFSNNECAGGFFLTKQKPANGGTKRRQKFRVALNTWGAILRSMDDLVVAVGFVGSNQQNFLPVPLVF